MESLSMESLSIGQVAREVGIGIETVRFYEREGLIEEPRRKESGYRQFSADVIQRLRLIKRARAVGFSLKEIKEILSLGTDSLTTCADVRRQARAKIAETEAKIADLARMREALLALVEECEENRSRADCPFLQALASLD